MTAAKTSKVTEPEVEDLDDITADEAEVGYPDGWNGRKTRVTMARPLIRDQRFVPAGARVVFECSFSDGEWRGPEAEHMRDLIGLGMIANTPEAEDRTLAQAVIDDERGVRPHKQNPAGLPGLRQRTNEEVHRSLKSFLKDSPEAMLAAERNEVQSATKELAEAIGALAPALQQSVAIITAAQSIATEDGKE